MPKKRKCKLKTLPVRQCKKPKIAIRLRENRKTVNYDDNKYDALKYYDECETMSDHIELSSGDSKEKKEIEEIDTLDSESSSVVITNQSFVTTLFDMTFEDSNVNEIPTEEEPTTKINNSENTDKDKLTIGKFILDNSFSSAISLSSSETKSSISDNCRKKSKRSRQADEAATEPEEIYYVEKILDMKIVDGIKLFYLKWEGFPDTDNTWEPEENIQTNYMVQEFLSNLEDKNKECATDLTLPSSEEGQVNESSEKDENHSVEHNITENHDESSEKNATLPENKSIESKNIFDQLGNIEVPMNPENKEIITESDKCEDIVIKIDDDTKSSNDNATLSEELNNIPKDQVQTETSTPNNIVSENVDEDAVLEASKSNQDVRPQETKPAKLNETIKIGKILKKKNQKKLKRKSQKNIHDESCSSAERRKSKSLREILDKSDESQASDTNEKVVPAKNGNANRNSLDGNNETHSSNGSAQSSKKTNSKNSKDPNSFFPTNMPQTVQEIFMVEKILKMRMINGVRKFYLKWEGFPDSENTWEPEENLECPELIKEFLKEKRQKKKLKKRRSSSPEASPVLEELPEEVKIKEPVVKAKGFPRSREPESILSAGIIKDQLMFLIKWKNIDSANLVSARRANIECPQLVIRFHEDHLCWRNSDNSVTSMPKESLDLSIEENVQRILMKKQASHSENLGPSLQSLLINRVDFVANTNTTRVRSKIRPQTCMPPRSSFVPTIRPRLKISKAYRNIERKPIPDSHPKPVTGSSSHTMMNLIRNFKDRKVEVPLKPPMANVPRRPDPSPSVFDNFVSRRQYDSRDMPKEASPPKIELPKPVQVPVLRTINSYRGDLPRKPGIVIRPPSLNVPPSFSLPQSDPIPQFSGSQMNNNNIINNNNNPGITMVLDSSPLAGGGPPPLKTSNVMPNLTPAPNNDALASNSPLPSQQQQQQQISSFNVPAMNSYALVANNMMNQQQVIGPMNQQQQQQIANSPSVNQLQLADSLNNNAHMSSSNSGSASKCMLAADANNSILQTYLSVPSMSLNNYTQIPNLTLNNPNPSMNSNNFHSPMHQIRALTTSFDSQQMNNNGLINRTGANPVDQMTNYMPIYNNSQTTMSNRNSSRMQLAAALQSRYQQNIVMHPNIIPQGSVNLNSPVVIYQNPGQHSLPQYQYAINQQNFSAIPPGQHQQQSFYSQQPMSQSPVNTNSCLILPGDMNQQHLMQQSQIQYQHIKPQNSDLIQNSYLNLRAFL